jgi:hypothetical protein
MAKPRRILKRMLHLLDIQPMTFGDLLRKMRKNNKIISQNLTIAKSENLVYQDVLKQYRLTSLGKLAINYVENTDNFTRWQIETQEIDPIGLSDRPKVTCTLVTEKAKRIRELDNKTAPQKFNLERPENNTLIKLALARVVDSVLETLEKDLGLFTIREGNLADNSLLSSSSFLDHFPSYDYLKRYKNLANEDFMLQIEINGRKWLKKQRLNDLVKKIDDIRKSRKDYYRKNIFSSDRRKRIHDAILNLMQIREDFYKYAYLFKDKQEMREYLLEHFRSYGEQNDNLEEIVNKAYKCGLFRAEKRTYYYPKVNHEKYQPFMASLGNNSYESTTH